jgi:hypothetical protein
LWWKYPAGMELDASVVKSVVERALGATGSELTAGRRSRSSRETAKRTIGPGGLLHVESTTPRKVSNASDTDDSLLLVVGAKDGYVKRDGHMVDPADMERRPCSASSRRAAGPG